MPNTGLGELERLSNSECLLIDRRRRGENQHQAAQRLGTTPFMYGKWERDVVAGPTTKVLQLRPHECCLLYRRRVGKTQADVAHDLMCCRWWVNQMERGVVSPDVLLWYWEQ